MAKTPNYQWDLPNPSGLQIAEMSRVASAFGGIDAKIKAFEADYLAHTHAFDSLTGKPTTLAGYGIADGMTADEIATAIQKLKDDLVNGSGAALDTLKELADALGNDPNFAATVSNALGLRVRVDASSAFTLAQKAQGRANLDALGTVDKGQANGVAPLGGDGKLPSSYLPNGYGSSVQYALQSLTTAQQGQARSNIGAGILAGFRDKIISGDFGISQRGNNFTVPAGTNMYVADRWKVNNGTNQPLNVQAPALTEVGPYGAHPRLRLKFDTAPTTGEVAVYQLIEGASTLAGGPATMSFHQAFGEAITGSCYLRQFFGTGGSASVDLPAQTFSGTTGGAVGVVKKLFNLPETRSKIFGANNRLEYVLSFPIRSTQVVTITRAALVEGDATTEDDPFRPRHIQQELALCQRYFQRISAIELQATPVAGYPIRCTTLLPVPMRVSPAISFTAGSGTGHAVTSSSIADRLYLAGFPDGQGVITATAINLDAEL